MTTWPKPPAIPDDTAAELVPLDVHTCWQRIRTCSVGRVAVTTLEGTVLVLPVNFRVEDHAIVFRSAPGATLEHLHRGPVTFQVDAADAVARTGWSVLVHGHAKVEAEPCAHDAAPQPWAGAHRRHLVRIQADHVTGRELHPVDRQWDTRGYL